MIKNFIAHSGAYYIRDFTVPKFAAVVNPSKQQQPIDNQQSMPNRWWYLIDLTDNYRQKKKQHYTHEFAKYKNDIRKTWDTLKDIMNKKKSKEEFPTYFLNNGKYACDAKNIADKFNEYFTEIGPSLASEIDVSNKSPSTHI